MSNAVMYQGNPLQVTGHFPHVGQIMDNFTLVAKDLREVQLDDYLGKRKILNIFPCIDTRVCAASVRYFNKLANQLTNTSILCISNDLPFSQARFCGVEGVNNITMLSAFRHANFAKQCGVAVNDGVLQGLTARAVIVLDENHAVLHSQLVHEITAEPDYQAAYAVLAVN